METLPTTQFLQQRPQPPARCAGSRPEQSQVGAGGFTADNFLKHTFFPLCEPGKYLPEKEQVETALFNSLNLLKSSLGIGQMAVADKPYPYNVLLAYWDAEKHLKRINRDTTLLITDEDNNDWKFATIETADTGRNLYYIPLLPLGRLIDSGSEKRSTELLLSVCAYPYHCTGVPHYRDEESFLHYHYEIMNDELDNGWGDLDELDINRSRSALRFATHYGDTMQRRMHNPCHLQRFESRVQSFRADDDFQRDCLSVAKEALALWQTYPDAHLFKHVDNSCLHGENDEDEDDDYYGENDNCIAVYEYVHFVAEVRGGIYDSIIEMVNCEFNEKLYTQEPVLITRYDKNLPAERQTLGYEHRLFKLMNDLITILDELL